MPVKLIYTQILTYEPLTQAQCAKDAQDLINEVVTLEELAERDGGSIEYDIKAAVDDEPATQAVETIQ